ncbi:MAG: hypothetical protein LBI26_01700 [Holosporales bacterium]|jgi:F0F1-type ATP synthase membrane subunit b/b'|nr:hypothetical protein [Holosporales bacterium]
MLLDVHICLVISLIATLFVLYKFSYKKFNELIQNKIDTISQVFQNLEDRKLFAEKELKRLNELFVKIEGGIDNKIAEAHKKAEAMNSLLNKKLEKIIEQEEKGYNVAFQKIQSYILVEIQEKIVDLAVKEVIRIILEKKDIRETHNLSIDNALALFEDKENHFVH